MRYELESRNDKVMAVASVVTNSRMIKKSDEFTFAVPGISISFSPELPPIWKEKDAYLTLNVKCGNENDADKSLFLYEKSNLALYKVVSDSTGRSYTQEIVPDQVSELPKESLIVALPSDLSKDLRYEPQLIWGQKELRFKDSSEYYYTLGLLCQGAWFSLRFEIDPKRLTVQYKIYCRCPVECMPRAFLRAETAGRIINNNEYVRNLCENHGFSKIGNKIWGDYTVVRETVPVEYLDAFDKAYENFQSWGKKLDFKIL